jgi:hypothetical protein
LIEGYAIQSKPNYAWHKRADLWPAPRSGARRTVKQLILCRVLRDLGTNSPIVANRVEYLSPKIRYAAGMRPVVELSRTAADEIGGVRWR